MEEVCGSRMQRYSDLQALTRNCGEHQGRIENRWKRFLLPNCSLAKSSDKNYKTQRHGRHGDDKHTRSADSSV